MAQMSLQRLNELMRKAVESLQDDRATVVSFVDPNKPLLPESYWREQLERSQQDAINKAADLFERSLDIARVRMKRRAEDERLANLSVDELLDDVGALWQPDMHTSWGRTPMSRSGGTLNPPTQGPQAPSYDYECYQCGRPLTEHGQNHWVDHSGKDRCDHMLMTDWHDMDDVPTWHQPKPFHGEEEDEDA